MLVEFLGLRRYGKGRKAYYAIRLGRIVKLKRWITVVFTFSPASAFIERRSSLVHGRSLVVFFV
jgi:hypothetical protein